MEGGSPPPIYYLCDFHLFSVRLSKKVCTIVARGLGDRLPICLKMLGIPVDVSLATSDHPDRDFILYVGALIHMWSMNFFFLTIFWREGNHPIKKIIISEKEIFIYFLDFFVHKFLEGGSPPAPHKNIKKYCFFIYFICC